MALKFFFIATVVAVANIGLISQHGLGFATPVPKHIVHVDDDYDYHPQYNFSYDIQDVPNGDFKSHEESRDGDFVKGSYTVVDPDDYKRIVEYTVDGRSGFKAVVSRVFFGRPVVDPVPPIDFDFGHYDGPRGHHQARKQ